MPVIIHPLPAYTRVLDRLMVPVMAVLGGFRPGALQETHRWHQQAIDPNSIDQSLAVSIEGSDETRYRGYYGFLFHVPILGGWTRYSVYEVPSSAVPFRIGWAPVNAATGEVTKAEIQRLLIRSPRIRTLDGPTKHRVLFFAFNEQGEQMPLKRVGRGRLGDGQYLSVRLF